MTLNFIKKNMKHLVQDKVSSGWTVLYVFMLQGCSSKILSYYSQAIIFLEMYFRLHHIFINVSANIDTIKNTVAG